MNWLGKLVGGAAGLVLGGPVGAALGVLAGHLLDDKLTREAENSKPRPPQRRNTAGTEAYARNPDLANLLLDSYFNKTVKKAQENWRKVVSLAAECGVAAPTFSSALSYYDSYRSARLPANLLQAQRDYFGAHTYERTDQPRGKFYHIDWPEAARPQLEA